MIAGFNVRKAAQVAAFFALSEGGSINVLKLVKLIYLADRKFLELYDAPILYDHLVSMPHGPVNSWTYNYIQGEEESRENWDTFVTDRANHNISIAGSDISLDALDELSRAEVRVLTETAAKYKNYTGFQLRDLTHQICPEWEDPSGSSATIPYVRILKYLNKPNASEIADEIDLHRNQIAILSTQ